MTETAIAVEGLSKRYRLAHENGRGDGLRHRLERAFRNPWQFLATLPASSKTHSDDFWALRDISFDIAQGEVVGIIGRNGAGKSTLLKILSRITEPTSGTIRLKGRVASLLEVGTGFHPELTGRENIFLNGAILGMARAEIKSKFDDIVAFSEVEKFLDTPVKRYSSGMYVRLAFAVAAHLEPEILIVDEVLAVGDSAFQQKCLGKMAEVARSGRTILFVSHNAAAVQQLCTRAILLASGQIANDGAPEEIIRFYVSAAGNRDATITDLSEHRDRPSHQHPLLRELRLLNGAGEPSNVFAPGGTLVAEILLNPDRRINEPRIALAIEDYMGRRLWTVASQFQSPLGPIDGPCRVRCTVPDLGLGAGYYLLSVSVSDKYEGMLDGLYNVASLEIIWTDDYLNGEPYLKDYGPVLKRAEWQRLT